jgi:hypothetical protein
MEVLVIKENMATDSELNKDYTTLLEMWREEKKRRQEVEGENTIIKGIGNNSPEMKALQKENEELKAELARAKEDHQYDNLVHQQELDKLLKNEKKYKV